MRSGQVDPQANLKIRSFLHMLESPYLKSLISNLLGITQLPLMAKEDGIECTMKRLATDDLVTRKAIIKNADSLFNAVSHKTKIPSM